VGGFLLSTQKFAAKLEVGVGNNPPHPPDPPRVRGLLISRWPANRHLIINARLQRAAGWQCVAHLTSQAAAILIAANGWEGSHEASRFPFERLSLDLFAPDDDASLRLQRDLVSIKL
jgi:hypothetical protein